MSADAIERLRVKSEILDYLVFMGLIRVEVMNENTILVTHASSSSGSVAISSGDLTVTKPRANDLTTIAQSYKKRTKYFEHYDDSH